MPDYAEKGALAIQKNWSKFGKLRKYCLYTSKPDSDNYDPANGTITETSAGQTNLYIIFDDFTFTELRAAKERSDKSSPILKNDKKAIFPALDIAPFMPFVDDEIIDEDNVKWIVKGVSSDPLPMVYELHVRQVS